MSPWLSSSAGMLPGCCVTSTAPSPYLRPSFTQETKGLFSFAGLIPQIFRISAGFTS